MVDYIAKKHILRDVTRNGIGRKEELRDNLRETIRGVHCVTGLQDGESSVYFSRTGCLASWMMTLNLSSVNEKKNGQGLAKVPPARADRQ